MTSSGIKRGLASTAIAALAVTGLPFLATSASATPIADTLAPTQVVLYTPEGVGVSTKNDGQNTTVSLLASGGSSITSVQFQYSVDAGTTWTDIGAPVARNADGVFGTEWTTAVPATLTTVRAVGGPGGTNDSDAVASFPNEDAVESDSEGSLGVFQAPYAGPNDGDYVGVTGTVTEGGDVISVWDQSHGTEPLPGVNATEAEGSSTTGGDIWNAVVDITGYAYSGGAEPNQIVLGAFTTWAHDAEGSSLYVQTIGSITADPATQEDASPADSTTTLTVLDTQGNPVAHAQVYRGGDTDTDGGGADTDTDGAEELVGYTDGFGQIVADPAAGPEAGPGVAGTEKYYVNTTGTTGFESGTDKAVDVTVTTYTPALTTVDIVNERNRSNFDRDEFGDSDDFTIVTLDQRGNPINEDLAGADVEYRYIIDPSAAGATITTAWTAAETDANGEAVVASPAGQPEGAYTLEARRPNVGGTGLMNATPENFAGSDAAITFAEGSDANAPVNGTTTIDGNLANDGGGLAGREIRLDYTAAGLGDADFAPQAAQPAGVDVSPDAGGPGSTVTTVTDADGDFSVALRDPAIPANVTPTEEDGTLAADAREATGDATDLNADDTIAVHWIVQPEVSSIDITGAVLHPAGTFGFPSTQPGPGVPLDLDIEVHGEDGDANPANDPVLQDFPVTVEVSKGFLSPNAESANGLTLADGQDDEGDLWGFVQNDGTEQEISTGDDAEAGIVAAIERDADFDDDGRASGTVTITAGDVTETVDVDWNAEWAINLTSVELPREADEPAGTVPVGAAVDFQLYATDQFGNLAGDIWADINDDSTVADFETDEDGDETQTDYTVDAPGITAFSDAATTQTLTASINSGESLVNSSGDATWGIETYTGSSDPIVYGRSAIDVQLNGQNNGAADDVLKVDGPRKAAGAVVKLFKIKKDGTRVKVGQGVLNAKGNKKFVVNDKNGRNYTKYVAKVLRTNDTKADTSNKKRVR